MTNSSTRRKFLTLLGAGTAGLAGCSTSQNNPVNDTNTTDTTDAPPSEEDIPDHTPETSAYVENGQLTVRPFVDVFGFVGATGDTVDLLMTAMPNPVADYDINVHYTPLSAVDTEWRIKPVRTGLYSGVKPEYDEENNVWSVGDRVGAVTTIREAKENGVQIGTIEVPSESAGLMGAGVKDPYERDDIDAIYDDEENTVTFASDESEERFWEWIENNIPALGYDYTDYVQRMIETDALLKSEFQYNTGSWFSGSEPITPPFMKKISFSLSDSQISDLGLTRHRDEGFPEQEPFVLTFTVDDPNAKYNDPDKIVTQTPTAVASPSDANSLYTPDVRIPDNSIETSLQKNWSKGITNGDEWKEVGLDEYYQDVDYSSDGSVTEAKASRLTNYGRYSPKMERYSQRLIDSPTPRTRAPEQFLATEPFAYLDSPIQSAWTISYQVESEDMLEAQQDAVRIKNANSRSDAYEKIAANAQGYDVIQDVIHQLRQVCDNIGTETPTEEVRVVADFVSNMTHIALNQNPPEGSLEGFGTPGQQHPVWTLYNQTGDCEDFTVLANTILSSDEFGYTPSVAVADSLSFSRSSSDISHLSTSIPMSELEIEDARDDAIMEFRTELGVYIQEDVQYSHNGEKYAYVEMSAPFPIGTTNGRRSRTANPEPLETWSF